MWIWYQNIFLELLLDELLDVRSALALMPNSELEFILSQIFYLKWNIDYFSLCLHMPYPISPALIANQSPIQGKRTTKKSSEAIKSAHGHHLVDIQTKMHSGCLTKSLKTRLLTLPRCLGL